MTRPYLCWPNGTSVQHKKSGRVGVIVNSRGSILPDQYLVRWEDGGEQWVNTRKLRRRYVGDHKGEQNSGLAG